MRYLGWLLWVLKLALFAVVVLFLVRNAEPVTVRYFLGAEWQAPLFLVLSVTFLAGILLGVVAILAQVVRQRREIAALRRALGTDRAGKSAETA
jgi:lipopolysaccharide assembly protein A